MQDSQRLRFLRFGIWDSWGLGFLEFNIPRGQNSRRLSIPTIRDSQIWDSLGLRVPGAPRTVGFTIPTADAHIPPTNTPKRRTPQPSPSSLLLLLLPLSLATSAEVPSRDLSPRTRGEALPGPGGRGGLRRRGAPTRLSQPIRRRRNERHPRAHTRAHTRSHTLAQRDRPPPACWPGCGAGAAAEAARPRAARRPPARRAPHCSSRLPPAGPPALACPPAGGQREPRRLGNPGPRDPLPPLCPRT